jgi:hypothetical protein
MRAAAVRAICLAGAAACAACSIPEKIDTFQPPFACNKAQLPTEADDPVTISGHVIDAFSQQPVPGATVTGFVIVPGTDDTPVFKVTTDATGRFVQVQSTLGIPRAIMLSAHLDGYLDTHYYPAVKLAHDLDTDIDILTPDNLTGLTMLGMVTVDMTKANFFVTAVDCNDDPVGGVQIMTDQPTATTLYFAGGNPDKTAVATDAKTGTALIINVPVGSTTFSGTVLDTNTAMRANTIDGAAGALIQTEIQP